MTKDMPTPCEHGKVHVRLSLGDVRCAACGMIAPLTDPIDWSKGVMPVRVRTQAEISDVRPLDLDGARKAVEPIVRAELAAERWPDSERDRLERELIASRAIVERAVGLLDSATLKTAVRDCNCERCNVWLDEARAFLAEIRERGKGPPHHKMPFPAG